MKEEARRKTYERGAGGKGREEVSVKREEKSERENLTKLFEGARLLR